MSMEVFCEFLNSNLRFYYNLIIFISNVGIIVVCIIVVVVFIFVFLWWFVLVFGLYCFFINVCGYMLWCFERK